MVVALVVILGVLAAPAHAVSMAVAEIAPAEHFAAPCPMSGMMAMDHGTEDEGGSPPMVSGMACCGAQVLGGIDRPVLPVQSISPVLVEAVHAVLAALAHPVVDPQPPRG